MTRLLASLLAVPALATGAAAHPGDHAKMGLTELISHFAEPDHLAFAALTVIVGWLAFRAGRRAEARRQAKRNDGEMRP